MSDRPVERADSWTLVAGAALAAVALGRAIQVEDGYGAPEAFVWVGVALLAVAIAVFGPRVPLLERAGERPALVLVGIGLVAQFAQLVTRDPAYYMTESSPAELTAFRAGIAATGMVAAAAFVGSPAIRRWATPLFLVAYVLAGTWVIQSAPDPFIDVVSYHRESIAALAEGQNPYAIYLQNVYDPGRVDFGFPYPPLSLLLSAPGELLLGDFRYAHLLAAAIAGALIAYGRRSALAVGAAALFLFTPRAFFVIEEGWTEPLMVLLVAAVGVAAVRRSRWTPYLAGALLVSKQHALVLVPALLSVADRSSRRRLLGWGLRAAVVGLVVTLPFLLWNPERFVYDLITLQTKFSFNPDALTFLAFWPGPGEPPLWLGPALAPVVGVVAALRAPRTGAGFAASSALIAFAFFAFSRYAYANYFFFILGALLVAVGVADPPPSTKTPSDQARSASDA